MERNAYHVQRVGYMPLEKQDNYANPSGPPGVIPSFCGSSQSFSVLNEVCFLIF